MQPLFPTLLGADAWQALPASVQRMHGSSVRVVAEGEADIDGARHALARLLRRMLGLPEPGPRQPLRVVIEPSGRQETWTRQFHSRHMRSVLSRREGSDLLYERLGPTMLAFALRRDGEAIDWSLQHVRVLGLPVPRAFFGSVVSRSGHADGRYAFFVETRMPLIGLLVAYRGWLEIVADA
ncbi:DUF4166 domain-containing protein [Dyella sp.]|uniref:DUF4166 domain-containing protein n=1 Tax=Dyella sp. TaxID=1869338 RepID=UPI002ED09D59